MENRWQIATSAGVLAAVWCGVADLFHLVTWVGFLGCTTYFAQPKAGFQGVLLGWATNLSGVFWAWLIITGAGFFDSAFMGYLFCGLATMGMCLQASYHRLSFIPGAFVGCCATFGMAGDVASVLPALFVGVLLGYSMTCFTGVLISWTQKLKPAEKKRETKLAEEAS